MNIKHSEKGDKSMNLNKEERLEQIRNILIGSQIGNLEKKLAFLEKGLDDEGLKKQLERRLDDIEKFIYEELSSFKQLLELEQAKHEKVDESLQQLQTTSPNLSIELSRLEKKDVANENSKKQLERRINDLEKLIYKEFGSFKQILGFEQTKYEKANKHLQQLQETSQGLSIKLSKLQEEAVADENSKRQFEKFINEELSLFKQLLEFEQAKHEKANEYLQQLQETSQDLSIKLSKLEKEAEQSQNLQSGELTEVRKHIKSLKSDLDHQEIENKNAYEYLHKSLQKYTEWRAELSELEQKTLKNERVLQKMSQFYKSIY